jgi:hypothetical protein
MKQMKILGVLAIALTLGLTACSGGNGDKSGEQQSGGSQAPAHKHEAAEDAQWQANDTQHWKDCKDNDGGKVNLASHSWVADDSKQSVPATCEAEGKAYEKCSVCGKTRERTLQKTAHTYAKDAETGEDVVVWTTQPDCTNGGVGEKECTVCHQKAEVTSDPLGHIYEQEDGADKVVWSSEPDCTHGGTGEKECTRCHEKATVTADPLGHDIQLIGDDTEPEAGKAKVRIYSCAHGCGTTYLGFKASEVSEESKSHLVIGDDGGARFWGRPIGNDVALSDDGSPSEDSHDAVFNEEQPGDFFEYVFDLTADQVKVLGEECLLYCDATPAQWMRNNNMDFFACKPGDTDWTRGMYIDDIAETEENEKGTEIDDYRYILYVDDQPKAFDDSITNPVRSDNRAEFILPYVFKLHAGENKISLRMAGGYRSTFYNFTFRPVVKEGDEGGEGGEQQGIAWPEANPTPINTSSWTAGTAAKNSAGKDYTPLTGNGKNGVKIAFADVSSGTWDGTKLSSSADSGVTYQVKAAKAGIYQLIMKAKTSSSGNGKKFNSSSDSRNVIVKVNGDATKANVYGERTEVEAGLNNDTKVEFVLALVYLTGNEDSIYLENRYFRIDFDSSFDLIFAEI